MWSLSVLCVLAMLAQVSGIARHNAIRIGIAVLLAVCDLKPVESPEVAAGAQCGASCVRWGYVVLEVGDVRRLDTKELLDLVAAVTGLCDVPKVGGDANSSTRLTGG